LSPPKASGAANYQYGGNQSDINAASFLSSINSASAVNLHLSTQPHRVAVRMDYLERDFAEETRKNNLPGVMLAATNFNGR